MKAKSSPPPKKKKKIKDDNGNENKQVEKEVHLIRVRNMEEKRGQHE